MDSNKKRHTHSTAAALEDALAVANEAEDAAQISITRAMQTGRFSELVDALEHNLNRLRRIIDILKQARVSPYSYDADQESGRRFIYKKR